MRSMSPIGRKKSPSIVLLSGGLDSTVAALVARRERPGHPLALLHLNYGHRAEARELAAFRKLAAFLGAERRLALDLPHLGKIGGSSLTDPALRMPRRLGPGTPATYVPFRNANLLAAAVAWAEVIGADRIYLGVNEPDSRHYPDTRGKFLRAFNRAVREGTRPESRITIQAPLLRLSKAGIVRLGEKLGAPFHLTWSCYRGGSRPCGSCPSCLIRARAFREAGLGDSLPAGPVRSGPRPGRAGRKRR